MSKNGQINQKQDANRGSNGSRRRQHVPYGHHAPPVPTAVRKKEDAEAQTQVQTKNGTAIAGSRPYNPRNFHNDPGIVNGAKTNAPPLQQRLGLPIAAPKPAPRPKAIQTKLTIGQPGDKYEKEADEMAAKAISTPDSALTASSGNGPSINTKKEDGPQAKVEKKPPTVQQKTDQNGSKGGKLIAPKPDTSAVNIQQRNNSLQPKTDPSVVNGFKQGAPKLSTRLKMPEIQSMDDEVESPTTAAQEAVHQKEEKASVPELSMSQDMPVTKMEADRASLKGGRIVDEEGNMVGLKEDPLAMSPTHPPGDTTSPNTTLQRSGPPSGKEVPEPSESELLNMKPEADQPLMMSDGAGGRTGTPALESKLNSSKGGGSPLSEGTRNYMEPRLGGDFSGVRVHTGDDAVQMNQGLGSQAFAHGKDVYFNQNKYQPETTSGKELLAHELTHTMQQGASPVQTRRCDGPDRATPMVQKEEGAVSAPGKPDSIIELGSSFDPNSEWETYIIQEEETDVDVKLGELGAGQIKVKVKEQTEGGNTEYETVSTQYIDLAHPALAGLADAGVAPVIVIKIEEGNNVTGYLTGRLGDTAIPYVDFLNKIEEFNESIKWTGLDGLNIDTSAVTNEIQGGKLNFMVNNMDFKLGGFLEGDGSFGFNDTNFVFSASAEVDIKGLTTVSIDIERDEEGNLKGRVEVPVEIQQFSGEVIAEFVNDNVDVQGTVSYQSEKFDGSVTLIWASQSKAREAVEEQIGSENLIQQAESSEPATAQDGDEPKVLVGYGNLTFRLTEWFAGTADVVVDDNGYVTVKGEIAPPAEVEIMPQRDYITELLKLELRFIYGVPILGSIFAFCNISLEALAKLGPAKLYNIKVSGLYSTDPDVLQNFSIEASLNFSAFAGLRLRAEAGIGLSILGHDIKLGVGVWALAGIRGYIEATPKIEYQERQGDAGGKIGESFLRGHLELAAQPFLGLGGDLFVELDSPWWSPAPDDKWTWPLGELEYPLPGEFGIGVDIDYKIGSGEFPEMSFGEVEFNKDKFMTDLMNDHVPPKKGAGDEEKEGEWDDNLKGQGDGGLKEGSHEPDLENMSKEEKFIPGLDKVAEMSTDNNDGPGILESALKDKLKDVKRKYEFDELEYEEDGKDHVIVIGESGDFDNEEEPIRIKTLTWTKYKKLKGEAEEWIKDQIKAKQNDDKEIEKEDIGKIAEDLPGKHPIFNKAKPLPQPESFDLEVESLAANKTEQMDGAPRADFDLDDDQELYDTAVSPFTTVAEKPHELKWVKSGARSEAVDGFELHVASVNPVKFEALIEEARQTIPGLASDDLKTKKLALIDVCIDKKKKVDEAQAEIVKLKAEYKNESSDDAKKKILDKVLELSKPMQELGNDMAELHPYTQVQNIEYYNRLLREDVWAIVQREAINAKAKYPDSNLEKDPPQPTWALVFAIPGNEMLMQGAKEGESEKVTLEKAWGTKFKSAGDTLLNAMIKTIEGAKHVKDKKKGFLDYKTDEAMKLPENAGKKWEDVYEDIYDEMVEEAGTQADIILEQMSSKELMAIGFTNVVRSLKSDKVTIGSGKSSMSLSAKNFMQRNPGTDNFKNIKNRQCYHKLKELHQSEVISDLKGIQIHHALSLYLGGANTGKNLVSLLGGVGPDDPHGWMHILLDETKIQAMVDGSVVETSLKYEDISNYFLGAKAKLLVGVADSNAQVHYSVVTDPEITFSQRMDYFKNSK